MDDYLSPLDADTDDECDWEEVEVPEAGPRTIEITLNAQPKAEADKKKKGISHAERLARIDCHKMHTVSLLANASIRNRWLNDELLQARLLSLCPLKLQDAFAVIHKSRVPDPNQRGRMFENAMRGLTDWWSSSFEVVPEGHIRSRTFHDVEKILERYRLLSNNDDSSNDEMDLEVIQDILGEDGEFIRSPNSLMKRALMTSGSRDVSSQLFTALCRALSIPARLVVSIQSVPWQAGVGKPKPRYEKKTQGKGKVSSADTTSQASQQGDSEDESDMEEVDIPSPSVSKRDIKGKGRETSFPGTGNRLDGSSKIHKGKGKQKAKPPIKLRKQRPKGRRLGSTSPSTPDIGSPPPDPTSTPPIFWTEVFSKPDGRWLPVDPVRSIVNKRKVFDPTPAPISAPPNAAVAQFSRFNSPMPNRRPLRTPLRPENRLVYVLAFEEDSYARDVTRRYARDFSTKVSKMQGGSGAANMGSGGKGRVVWWNQVLSLIHRPYRLHRDDVEDEELETAQMLEGMPTTMGGFKDHPIYVLERHLKQNETIHPPPPTTPELGKFRGEPVYPKSAVVSLKTAENWMRSEGRTIKASEQPLKMVKIRASTVNKTRELEVLKEAGANAEGGPSTEIMQGLYARLQTEPYIPDPIVNGIVPKNNFGNIDLYVPSMLPRGAAHIPYKGVAKIARKLGFDFAEAVTGFEFRKRRALPIIDGIVVAKENEAVILEAFWEAERIAEEKARAKREERVIKQWARLIHGLRIRQRLQKQYGRASDRTHEGITAESTGPENHAEEAGARNPVLENEEASGHHGGGFLVEAGDVVQAFHLPKFQYVPNEPVMSFQAGGRQTPTTTDPSKQASVSVPLDDIESESEPLGAAADFMTYDLDEEDTIMIDDIADMSDTLRPPSAPRPKTMAELAQDAEERQQEHKSSTSSPRPSTPQPLHRVQPSGKLGKGVGGHNEHTNPGSPEAGPTNNDKADVEKPSSSGTLEALNGPMQLDLDTGPNINTRGMTQKLRSAARVKASSSRAKPNKPSENGLTSAITSAASRRRSTRISGRKRPLKDLSESDVDDIGEGDDVEDYDGAKELSRTLARKKPKTRASAISAARGSPRSHSNPTSSTSKRTLRPRTSKTAARIGEEEHPEVA